MPARSSTGITTSAASSGCGTPSARVTADRRGSRAPPSRTSSRAPRRGRAGSARGRRSRRAGSASAGAAASARRGRDGSQRADGAAQGEDGPQGQRAGRGRGDDERGEREARAAASAAYTPPVVQSRSGLVDRAGAERDLHRVAELRGRDRVDERADSEPCCRLAGADRAARGREGRAPGPDGAGERDDEADPGQRRASAGCAAERAEPGRDPRLEQVGRDGGRGERCDGREESATASRIRATVMPWRSRSRREAWRPMRCQKREDVVIDARP